MDAVKRIKFYFICCLVTLNGLFIGYAVGLNSRHVLVVDPSLPKYVKPEVKADVTPKEKSETTDKTKSTAGKGSKDKSQVGSKDKSESVVNNSTKDSLVKSKTRESGSGKSNSDSKSAGAKNKTNSKAKAESAHDSQPQNHGASGAKDKPTGKSVSSHEKT